ncbi:MAG: SpaH/EbpB family LPXTG-anchored major pilin, partial [Firmicutes bacterium]|nr:SpaH/EbpB family LPXTG-anchored major pilin [Bacillota bacterium]
MKHTKKLAGIILALVMAFAMTCTVFAANIINPTGHTYAAYQIFSGTQEQSDTDAPLGDIVWGNGIKSAGFLAALQRDSRFVKDDKNIFGTAEDNKTAAQIAEILAANTGVAEAFANVAAQYLTSEYTTVAVTTELTAGYYLLVDITPNLPENDAYNSALLQVTKNSSVTIEKKYEVPTVDKAIVEGENTVEATDVNIGDTVTFRLTGTLPSNYADYETYKYVFHDTMSAGLTFNSASVAVKVDGNTIEPSEYSVVTSNLDANCTFEVVFENLKIAAPAATKDSKIVVEYTATLNSNAVIGSSGNPNIVKLEYSNNPNATGDGTPTTGKTPEDKVIVFAYELDVTKVDGAKKDDGNYTKTLKDAEFVLYRGEGDNIEYAVVDENSKISGWTKTLTVPEGQTGTAASVLKSGADGTFKVTGLDADTYYLKETKAPAGYNQLTDPIKIVISATVETSEDDPALTALTIKVGEGDVQNGTLSTGIVAMTVENNAGSLLPSTGGIGTTIFYVVGGLFVVAAGVLL